MRGEKKMAKRPDNKIKVTETLKSIGSPETISFDEMKKLVSQFNEMKKNIKLQTKDMSKEDKKKLGIIKGKKREISEQIKPFIAKVFKLISDYQDNLADEFKLTISDEKPEGQKWLTFKSDDGFTFCINKIGENVEPESEETK